MRMRAHLPEGRRLPQWVVDVILLPEPFAYVGLVSPTLESKHELQLPGTASVGNFMVLRWEQLKGREGVNLPIRKL